LRLRARFSDLGVAAHRKTKPALGLQALATPGHLVIAASTRQQIGELFDLEDLGPQQLAGFADPQPAWMVLRESTGSAGS
jgi:class 3 adenylate cyclase